MAIRSLAEKRAIITGASSGIGAALAKEAAARGIKSVITGRDPVRLAKTATECRALGGNVIEVVGDLTEQSVRDQLRQVVESNFGGLDILVNNAGVGATGHFQVARPDRLRTIMEVNFFAPVELCRVCIPLLKLGSEPGILMINSVAGRRAIPSRSEYSASKFALMGFSEALRAELAKDNVSVNVVSPGLTESSFEDHMLENTARHSLHAQRSMSSSEAAKLIWNAYAANRNETTLTFKAKLLVTLNRLAPRFIDRKMAGFVRKLYEKEAKQLVDS